MHPVFDTFNRYRAAFPDADNPLTYQFHFTLEELQKMIEVAIQRGEPYIFEYDHSCIDKLNVYFASEKAYGMGQNKEA